MHEVTCMHGIGGAPVSFSFPYPHRTGSDRTRTTRAIEGNSQQAYYVMDNTHSRIGASATQKYYRGVLLDWSLQAVLSVCFRLIIDNLSLFPGSMTLT